MRESFYKEPVPAILLAVGAAVVVHKANANAAQALGIPIAAMALLVAFVLAVAGSSTS